MKKSTRPGIILYLDDMQALDEADDAEFGRLIRLLLEYERTGVKEKVEGGMGMIYSVMVNKLVRDQERYEKICRVNSESARRRWEKQKQTDANACDGIPAQEESMPNMPKETETETETQTITTTTTETVTQGAAQVCHAPEEDGRRGGDGGMGEVLSFEVSSLIEKYQAYSGNTYLLVKENFLALSEQYGSDWLQKAVDCAIRAGNLKISYIRGILRNWAQAGHPDESEFREKTRRCDNPALNYSQRTNSLEDLYMDL